MNLSKNCPQLKGLDFSQEEINDCGRNNSVLRLSIALSMKCNLKCPYCYANACYPNLESGPKQELSLGEIRDLIAQAKENGAKTIELVGGEPLLHPQIKRIVSFINAEHLIPLIFTNGTIMDEELAEFLYENNASLIAKLNSLDNPDIQNEMVGDVAGTFEKMQETISILQKKGFNKTKPTRLAIETVLCKTNISQIPKLFRFARKNNIYPFFEVVTPAGRGKNYPPKLTKEEAKKIFHELLAIDEAEFGYTWVPRPPMAATACKYYFTAIYVYSDGRVQPCPTVNIELGNIRKERLSKILKKPETKKIRDVRNNIKGKCKRCSYHTDCYGCRGAAFNSTGGIFNEDPLCWI